VTNLLYEPVSAGYAYEKCIDIALCEGWKTIEDHKIFCLGT
jgi:hypothetical protein